MESESFYLSDGTRVTPMLPLFRRLGILKETPASDGLSNFRFRSIPEAIAEDAEEFLDELEE